LERLQSQGPLRPGGEPGRFVEIEKKNRLDGQPMPLTFVKSIVRRSTPEELVRAAKVVKGPLQNINN
jgi:hypothetical protein